MRGRRLTVGAAPGFVIPRVEAGVDDRVFVLVLVFVFVVLMGMFVWGPLLGCRRGVFAGSMAGLYVRRGDGTKWDGRVVQAESCVTTDCR